MIDTTLSLKERLIDVTSKIPAAEERARAEGDMIAVQGDGGRWAGSMQLLDELNCERRDLERQIRGHALNAKMDELTAIQRDISRLQSERTSAQTTVSTMKTQNAVIRYTRGMEVAIKAGVGHAWDVIKPWLTSLKPRTQAPPQVGAMNFSDWPRELVFTESERLQLYQFIEAQDALNRVESALASAFDRQRALIAATPELK